MIYSSNISNSSIIAVDISSIDGLIILYFNSSIKLFILLFFSDSIFGWIILSLDKISLNKFIDLSIYSLELKFFPN